MIRTRDPHLGKVEALASLRTWIGSESTAQGSRTLGCRRYAASVVAYQELK